MGTHILPEVTLITLRASSSCEQLVTDFVADHQTESSLRLYTDEYE
jgi:hypothetical protein